MTKTKALKNVPFLLVIFVDIILLVAVMFLMNHVQGLLESDAKINLTEIVTQNKDVITSKLMMEINNLDLSSNQIADRLSQSGDISPDNVRTVFLQYAAAKNDRKIFIALKDGTAYFPGGEMVDISGRQYFRFAAKEGKQNISERTVSRLDGQDIFVISVPLRYNGEIIGSVQRPYTPLEIYDICSVSLFSEQGSMYIINSQGYIQVSSQQNVYNQESDNYYRLLYPDNPAASKCLKADIQKEQAGFMETSMDKKRMFSAYTPIDKVYDWYLITSVATDAVSPNANIVIKLFYFILVVIVLLFAFSMLYYLRLKNKQQAHLEQLAFVDSVTGGNTYAKFTFDLQNLLREHRETQFYIFTFDIDNFKYINSYYGFDTGDKILRDINNLYAEKLSSNEFIARVYSDHFVILLEDISKERLNGMFASELNINGIAIYLSAGLYFIGSHEESISLMMDKANVAAQKIKGMRYKEVAIYSEEFDKEIMQSEQMKRSVEQALANNEIIPFFQPKVDINSGALAGAEALARWRTSDGRLISPGEFIPVCERTGLIVLVDMAIFEKTLQFIRHHLDNGIHCVPISVNFSRMHLLNSDFFAIILNKLNEYQVPAHLIELELTETVIFDNYQTIADFIHKLHTNGLQIAMDDFGSGYSSLHMLKDLDIDVLKIDRSFLKETADSYKQKAVFAAIAQMAEKLKIKVVVEGVENMENVELMREFGCTIAQGFFYAKPMDEESFGKIYEEGKI